MSSVRDCYAATVYFIVHCVGSGHSSEANVSATAKVRKGIIRDYFTGNGCKRIEGWLPRYLEFPFRSYCKDRGERLAEQAKRIKPLID